MYEDRSFESLENLTNNSVQKGNEVTSKIELIFLDSLDLKLI